LTKLLIFSVGGFVLSKLIYLLGFMVLIRFFPAFLVKQGNNLTKTRLYQKLISYDFGRKLIKYGFHPIYHLAENCNETISWVIGKIRFW